jgi:succinate dehydrogenase / fumarate reductase, cytochrome b subunit
MSWFKEVTESAVGKKAVMAVSGLVLFGFVLAHMVGNLEIYRGAEALNTYAEHLRTLGEPILPRELALWIARFVLLGAVFLHIHSAWAVSRQSRAARPIPYAKVAKVQATYATRTMRWGGVIIVLFILYHLAHLTLGVVHPNFVEGDVYHNVITGFRVPWVAAFYILANIALMAFGAFFSRSAGIIHDSILGAARSRAPSPSSSPSEICRSRSPSGSGSSSKDNSP